MSEPKRIAKPVLRVAIVHENPIIRNGLARVVAQSFDVSARYVGDVMQIDNANDASRAILVSRPHIAIYQHDFAGLSIEHMLATLSRHDLSVRLIGFDIDWSGTRLGPLLSAGVSGSLCLYDTEVTILRTIESCVAGQRPSFRLTQQKRSKRDIGRPIACGNVPNITAREVEVLQCIADGMSIESTADHLGISKSTVKNIRHTLYAKLNVPNSGAAVSSGKAMQLIK